MPGAGVVHHIIRYTSLRDENRSMSAMPRKRRVGSQSVVRRDGPFPDSCTAAKPSPIARHSTPSHQFETAVASSCQGGRAESLLISAAALVPTAGKHSQIEIH